ncbi:hypothetical protein [Teredinibacter turnerae]|uniref:hypothetical protein n=1 Tax=Teredinibacter turnerae TaxID=2426 RepID=UPI000401AD59|nr:hypothetical protein [Teredinibacter turnerae]
MSYINGPRINFWGGGSTNVDTANNTQYTPQIFDLADAAVTATETDEQIIEYLRAPTEDYFANGGWNYYGDHQFRLMNNKVSSSGHPGAVSTSGSLVGLDVFLLGSVDPLSGDGPYGSPVMVDLDPTSSVTSQIFAGGLQIGNGDSPALLVRGNAVSYSRFLGLRYDSNKVKPPYATPGSAYASGTFQLAFKKSDIVSYDVNDALLNDLINAPGAQGIVVRFEMFQFYPGIDSATMQQNYAENRNDANPSLGRIIGSIGPWFEGEPATTPPGRLLNNNGLGGAQGLAMIDATKSLLSLDLVSALEGAAIRQDGQANTSPIEPNVDYGNITVGIGSETFAECPSLPNDYYLYGGLYDIPLTPAQVTKLADNALVIGSTKNGLDIQEQPIRIYSDFRNNYVNETSPPLSEISLLILEYGGPLRTGVTVSLSSSSSGELPDGKFVSFPSEIHVPAGATSYTVNFGQIMGVDGFMMLTHTVNGYQAYFNSLRKYSEGAVEALLQADTVAWNDVYQQCLRFFYVLFPAMSKRIPLNDEATITAVGGEILKRISPEYRNTTLYMPLTRSLSPDKIALLKKYLEQT